MYLSRLARQRSTSGYSTPSTSRCESWGIDITRVVKQYTEKVKLLSEKPIIIGHSMGGLIVQLLLQQNLALAGVAIDSAPPMGLITAKWSFLKSNWPHITPFISKEKPIAMTFERFQYTFVNSMPLADQKLAYEKYVVPESRQVPLEALSARIDFSKPHPPLLFISGGADHIVPAALNKANFNRYKRSASKIDYKEFPGRVHFTIGQQGWENVANYILAWLGDLKL